MELDLFKLERTQAALQNLGLDCAIFHDFYNVSYLTGYTYFFENGPSPFTRGNAAVLLLPNHLTLIAEGGETSAENGNWTGNSVGFEGYNFKATTPPMDNFADATVQVFYDMAPSSGKIGYEPNFIPAVALERLQAVRPNLTWVPIPYMTMMNVRAIKSSAEIEKIQACARLAEVGQEAVRQLVQEPGKSEIEIYSQMKAVMEAYLGERFALQDALQIGINTQVPFPFMPTDYVSQEGDLVISDIVPYHNAYWGDTCSSYVVGGEAAVTDQHRAMHKIAHDAFLKGFEASKPGAKAGDIDALVRGYIQDHGYTYGHHTGHGLGVSNQDEPRIIIDGPTILEAGMVVVIEPPVYQEGFGGLRLERMYQITDSGAELMSHNSLDLA